ncbi:sensor histidine kinase [Vibrio campbellii]|uniref:sensor histidine kinase n=1 Tax=Vibrio campbellii TaxID=680 RepID=UPI0038CD2448
MSSSPNVKQALDRAQRNLLMRFMAILLLCFLVVEIAVSALFFLDLYRVEKKILNSMATEYQRILTYDSAQRLHHVLEANPQRLVSNNIAAYMVKNTQPESLEFIAGQAGISTDQPFSNYIIDDNFWLEAFFLNPYMTREISGEDYSFWLVLDNQSRYFIAVNQSAITFAALIVLIIVTTLFTRKVIGGAMSPLVTLGSLLDKLKHGKLEISELSEKSPQGLDVINMSVHNTVARLQHVTTTLNTTVDAIAHDVRTPLSRITLSSQSALMNDADPQAMRDALSDCAEQAMLASNMLTTLMKLNDEILGKQLPNYAPTNLSEVIHNVISWYEDVAEEKGIALEAIVSDELNIVSDPDKLIQVLVNLVDNAIKYTNPKGKVTIQAEQSTNGEAVIQVTDTGIGIEPKYHDLVFERLYRVDSSRSNISGYGLGLSFAAAIVDNIGGTIRLKSEVGVGSTFIITLRFH